MTTYSAQHSHFGSGHSVIATESDGTTWTLVPDVTQEDAERISQAYNDRARSN
ncbi:hypothetical protein [Mycolicibacterium sp.]|uniref:hypothetical protein n=1 Tax=Mycolicibacterium sp. TaxID=2320850 RepID=UPI0037C7881F